MFSSGIDENFLSVDMHYTHWAFSSSACASLWSQVGTGFGDPPRAMCFPQQLPYEKSRQGRYQIFHNVLNA